MHAFEYCYKCTQTDIDKNEGVSTRRRVLAHAQQRMQGLLCGTEFNNSQLEMSCCDILANSAE